MSVHKIVSNYFIQRDLIDLLCEEYEKLAERLSAMESYVGYWANEETGQRERAEKAEDILDRIKAIGANIPAAVYENPNEGTAYCIGYNAALADVKKAIEEQS